MAQDFVATTTRPGTGALSSLRADKSSNCDSVKAGGLDRGAHVRRAMGVAQPCAENDAVAAMGFDGERQQAAGASTRAGLAQHRREIGHIDHGVGGQNEIGAGIGLAAQALHHVGDFEFRIKPGGARPLDHARRQVDADEMIDLPGKGGRRQPGAAAEIDGALEEGRLARARRAPTAPP